MSEKKRSLFKKGKESNKPKDVERLSAREITKISRENRRITDKFERQNNRRNVPEKEYLTSMKNPGNVPAV